MLTILIKILNIFKFIVVKKIQNVQFSIVKDWEFKTKILINSSYCKQKLITKSTWNSHQTFIFSESSDLFCGIYRHLKLFFSVIL